METFEEHLDELLQTAEAADVNYKIWWLYKNERPRYVETLNNYLGFFRASIHAHFVAMLMALYKLGDGRSDSASIPTLLTEAKADTTFDREVLASAERKLEELKPTWEKIKIIRHKLFAHRDRHLSYKTVLKQADITYDEFHQLIEAFFAILGEMLLYTERTTWPRENDALEDTRRMLETLKWHDDN